MTPTTLSSSPNNSIAHPQSKSAMDKILNEKLEDQFDMFLKIFLTQMKHQDPSSPTDSTQITNNLLMFFSAAEQAKSNHYLKALNEHKEIETQMAARSYLDKEVEFFSDVIAFKGEEKEINYTIEGNAGIHDAKLAIVDMEGRPVFVQELKGKDIGVGAHKVTWDGKDMSGETVDSAHYLAKIIVTPTSSKKNETGAMPEKPIFIRPMIQGVGRVSEIVYNDKNEAHFIVDNIPIKFDDILKVRRIKNAYVTAPQPTVSEHQGGSSYGARPPVFVETTESRSSTPLSPNEDDRDYLFIN